MSLNNSTLRLITSTRESKIMTTFNFLTGKAYKTGSDIDNALQKAIKERNLSFTGFATITQARKQFIKVKAGAKGIKCPIVIAGGQVRYFYLFSMQDFTTCIDKRSKKVQKADPNSDQHDRIIRYALPGKITDKEKKALIAAASSYSDTDSTTYILDKDDADRDLFKVSFDHRSESEFKHDQQLKQWIAEGNKAEDFDQVVPFCDHAYGTLTPEQVEELSADRDEFCPF